MAEHILAGRGDGFLEIPRRAWASHFANAKEHSQQRLAFMSDDHHRVRNYVVRQLPVSGQAVPPAMIAGALNLPKAGVINILDELEENLTFLYRNISGEVAWAYPVTVDETPHHIHFSSGERLYGAWGEDAIATPFVQGRLRREQLTFNLHTSCACCGQKLEMVIDSQLHLHLAQPDAEPLVFSPDVDWATFEEPNIIHAYWNKSVFFWSEEHARLYRDQHDQVDGIYLTLEQMAFMTPITQGSLFGWL